MIRRFAVGFAAAALPVLGLLAAPAMAQTAARDRAAWGISTGFNGGYERWSLSYATAPLWDTTALGKPLTLTVEGDVAYWHWRHNASEGYATNMWQVGVTPMLQWWMGEHWYLEGGIGATAMQHTTFGDREISTAFQFGDHIGIGTVLDDDWRLGLRLSHFSNGSIKRPNPGLNLWEITLKRSF